MKTYIDMTAASIIGSRVMFKPLPGWRETVSYVLLTVSIFWIIQRLAKS